MQWQRPTPSTPDTEPPQAVPAPVELTLLTIALLSLAAPLAEMLGPATGADGPGWNSLHNALLIACLLPIAARRGLRHHANPIVLAHVVLLLTTFTVSTMFPGLTPQRSLRTFLSICLGIVAADIAFRRADRGRIEATLPLLAAASVGVGLVLWATDVRPFFRSDYGVFRLQGAALPTHLAQMALIGLMTSLWQLRRGVGSPVLALLNLAILLLTGSRLAVAQAALTTVVFACWVWRRSGAQRRQGAVLLLTMLAAFILYIPLLSLRLTTHNPSLPESVPIPGTQVRLSTASRLDAWRLYWDEARADLVFGRGLGAATIANTRMLPGGTGKALPTFRAPHNEYLRVLLDGGAVGMTVVLAGFFFLGRRRWRECPLENRGQLGLAFVVLAVDATVHNTLLTQQFSLPFWLFVAVLCNPANPPRSRPTTNVGRGAGSVLAGALVVSLSACNQQPGARLLFKSGFEPDVAIAASLERIVGHDRSTGYSWETDLRRNMDLEDARFVYDIGDHPVDGHVVTRIVPGAGRGGSHALLQVYESDAPGGPTTRNELTLFARGQSLSQFYFRGYLKFPPHLRENWRGSRFRSFMEWKEAIPAGCAAAANYRTFLAVINDDSSPALWWKASGFRVCPHPVEDWSVENRDVPVPVGRWFKLEVFFRKHAAAGRVWVAVDGQTIVDQRGRTEHTAPERLRLWSPLKVYRNSWDQVEASLGGDYQWWDDIEIWSDIPPAS